MSSEKQILPKYLQLDTLLNSVCNKLTLVLEQCRIAIWHYLSHSDLRHCCKKIY